MNADLLTIIILSVCTLLFVISKTHAAFVTLALCAGFVLSVFVGPGIFDFLSNSIDPNSFPLYSVVVLTLILIPALLVAWRFKSSQKGPTRLIQQIIPAFALSLLLVVFIFDALPESARETLKAESYIHSNFDSLEGWIVTFAVGAAIYDVMTQHHPKRKYKKRKKHE